jgi:predicted porin
MKKTLIALAVAGTFAAPAAFAASANVDFYGKFRVSVDHMDNNLGWRMADETSRVGFKGAEDLGGGLKAIYQYETGFNVGANAGNTSTNSAGGLGTQRDTFVGLAGDFGTVLAGRHDTPFKMVGSADLFADTAADAQGDTDLSIIRQDLRVNNAIAYVSPSFSGLTFMAATVVGNNQVASSTTTIGAGSYSCASGDIVGADGVDCFNVAAGTYVGPAIYTPGASSTTGTKTLKSLSDAYSLGAVYANGPLSLGLGYEYLGHVVSNVAGKGSQKAIKLNVGYTIDALKLGATVEKQQDILGVNSADSTNYLLSAAYGMGPITLAAQYGHVNQNATAGNNDLSDATVGVVYSLSKRTSTYLGYAHYKNSGASTGKLNVVTLGLNHDF